MFKEIFRPNVEIKEVPIEKEIKNETEKSLTEYYQTELLPLLKIFESSEETLPDQDGSLPSSVENFEDKILNDLRETVENNQNNQNRVTTSPEETIKEMKELLIQKFHSIISDIENKKIKGNNLNFDEKNLFKKAKIGLIISGDLSDWKKYCNQSRKNPLEPSADSLVIYYLEAEKHNWTNEEEDLRLSKTEVSALITGGMGQTLLKIENYKYDDLIKETPDELLQLLIKKNDYTIVEKVLQYSPSLDGYSEETINLLNKSDFGYLVLKYIPIFEKGLTVQAVKESIMLYSPDYPYHLNDIIGFLNKLNWNEDKKNEIIDFTFKHNNVLEDSYKKILSEKDAFKYSEIENQIKEITKSNNGWGDEKPKYISDENLAKLEKYINDGYLTFFHPHGDFVKYFSENKYEWLRDQALKYNQENVLLCYQVLKPEDQTIYAEKLINEDNLPTLKRLIERGTISESILSAEAYEKILKADQIIPLEFLSGKLNGESFSKILSNSNYLKGPDLFKNINRFDFKNDSNFSDYQKYQDLVNFVEEQFNLKGELTLYRDLKLEKDEIPREEIENYKKEISFKVDILKSRLDAIYPNISESETKMGLFCSEFGFSSFSKNESELISFLDTLVFLQIPIRQQNKGLFLNEVEIIKNFNPEKKIEVKNNLEKMLKIFNSVSQNELFIRYLNLASNEETSNEINNMNGISSIIPRYTVFYQNLDAEDKIFFQQIFPWSNSLASIADTPDEIYAQGKYMSPLLEESKKKLNLANESDGKLFVEYIDKFKSNNLPKLFDLFLSIKKSSDEDGLNPEIIKTLEIDFGLEITDPKNINLVLDKLQAVYQKIFVKNNTLIETKFKNSLENFKGTDNAYDYLKILALNDQIDKEDNDLIINFFEKYVEKQIPQKNLTNSGFMFRELKTPLNLEKWGINLTAYVNILEEINTNVPENLKKEILNLFSGDYRDECLGNMRQEWLQFLNSQDKNLPLRLGVISKTIEEGGGAGNLKYIEALGDIIAKVDKVFSNPRTVDRTKEETKDVLTQIEQRFDKDKWTQDDRAKFYNLTSDIIAAAPSLFATFAPVFEQISGKELKFMLNNIMPLYQVELIIAQNSDEENGETSYNPKDLVPIRQALINLAATLKLYPDEKNSIFEDEKNRLIEVMQTGFKKRFGLIKVPTEFKKAELQSIQNCIRYAGNISDRNSERETLIAFYLGLELSGDWEKFRQGQKINPEKYLTSEKASIIKSILENKKNNSLPLEIAGISENELEGFQKILQGEVSSNMVGNIETVDIKLGNIKRNMEELIDPDIYENEIDKKLVRILVDNGKLVGTVLSKTYGETIGKTIALNEVEKELKDKIANIFGLKNWTSENVKQVQDKIQPFSLITGMINKLEEEKVDENINKLQKNLQPSEKIIAIFNLLDVDFKQNSGALALTKDLEVLEELIIKNEAKLSSEEKISVNKYLATISESMLKLEITFQKTKEYFDKVKKSSHISKSELLKNRLSEIEKIIYSKGGEALVTSKLTKDLNVIVENMRQCLGCLRKEVNNDTNLAFGDYNKFFLISQKEKESGSIADEIVFFVPLKTSNKAPEMSFVMDKVYGTKSSDILIAHVLSVYKKYEALKSAFKNSTISISVSDAALTSVGLNQELFQKIIKEKIIDLKSTEYISDMIANIPESSLSDNYVEFGDKGAREKGERIFSGVVIK